MGDELERVAKAIHDASMPHMRSDGQSPPWETTTEECRAAARELARVAIGAMGYRVQPKSPYSHEDDHSWIDVNEQTPPTGMLIDMYLIANPHGFEVRHQYGYWYPNTLTGKDGKDRLTHWRHTTDAPKEEVWRHLEEMRRPPATVIDRLLGICGRR
ncbi:MAG: hypothetical protein ACOY4R_27575 [Pseudomonadota bacterium]